MESKIIIEIFRDKNGFENHRGELDEKKNQFDALLNEEIVKGKLAAAAGLALQPRNDVINPASVYPEMDLNDERQKKAFDIVTSFGESLGAGYGSNEEFICPTRKLRASDLPTKVLEELADANQYGFFEKIECYHDWDCFFDDHEDFLFVGFRDGKAYPIVYWGRKKTWENIEFKVKELEEKRKSEQFEKATGMPLEKQPSARSNWITPVALIVILLGVVASMFGVKEAYFDKKTEAAQIENPVEEIAECVCNHWWLNRKFNSLREVSDLSKGLIVASKAVFKCPADGTEHYKLHFTVNPQVRTIINVTKAIYSKTTRGEKVPREY